ncbi:MAG: SMP-30/gluconolactonase/LRE family protein [Cyclobacteriaceae bacterium]|nr:SMP-30/gluconolactonase/LRE family protein [Cyclobacteriaceae bacterium]
MKFIYILITSIIAFSCNQAQNTDIVQEGAVVEKLAGDFKFTEGPASDADGNVYFTDQPNDRIMKWSTDDKLTTWMQPSGRSNGLCFDNDGNLWSCADEKNELWIIGMDKEVQVLLNSYEGGKLNGPNDVWIAPDGSAFFSDPFYLRPWWDRDTTQQDGQCVYYLSGDQQELVRVIDDLEQPNGIIGTPDGKMLYVTDVKDKKTYSYSIDEDGRLSDKKLFCEMGSDGMTLDNKGNLYLTNAGGVFVFDKNGQQIKNVKIDESWTANVCFGGPDMKSLFITAKSGLYRIRMNVKGAGSQ